ncbi:unnamed protein product, partial [Rotaria magnacalcarata]
QQNYAEALELFQQSLKLKEIYLPQDHPSMAINYHNIANILCLQENYTNCLDYYVRAHQIRERYLPPNDTDIADSLYNIGFTYDQLNQPTRALEHLKKA